MADSMVKWLNKILGTGILLVVLNILPLLAMAYDYKPEIIQALNRRDTTAALSLIEAELKIDANYAPYYLLKGKIFFAREQYDEALEQFNLALKKRSKVYEALYYKGLVQLEKGELAKAKKSFDEGVKKAKDEKALFHDGLGLYFLNEEMYDSADVHFRKAIKIGPDLPEFHAHLGDANYFSGIYPLAIIEYEKVIEMDTSNLDIYFRLSRAYVAQGKYTEALNQLSVVLSRDSTYAQGWKQAGKLYTMAGLSANNRELKEQRFKEAIGSYRKFIDLSKDSADGEVFFNLGRSYFNLGGFAQADSAFEYVLSIGDVPKNIYLYLGRGYIGEERYQEGIDILLKQIDWLKEQDPDWQPTAADADLYWRIGDAYKSIDDYDNASGYFVTAAELDARSARYAVEAALAFHQLKNYQEALAYYQKRIELGPDSWNIFLNAAYCTLNLEDFELSTVYLEKVYELDSTNVKAVSLLSNTYLYQLKDCQNGVIWTEKWIVMDPADCDAYQNMGFAYFAGTCNNQYLTAVTNFRKALDCYKNKGQENCGNSDVMLYVAQAYHLYAAELLEKNQKEESKKYFKNAFDWYNNVLKCDPGNAEAKKGRSDTEFEF